MSDYTQTYSYTKVDAVDVVEAQDFEDIETEFGLIEVAINSKADATGDTVSIAALTVTSTATFSGATVATLGTVNGGTINAGLTWSAAQNLNSQALTNANIDSGDISGVTISGGLTWSAAQDLSSQVLTNVNVDSGTIDGAVIGGATPGAATVTTLQIDTSVTAGGAIKDEDDMASDSATALATQQSIKAYTDSRGTWEIKTSTDSPVTAVLGKKYFFDLSGGAIEIDLPSVGASDDGRTIEWQVDENADTNNLTIDPADTDTVGGETSIEVDLNHAAGVLVYDDTNTNWGL